ncbi:MAG: ankyrin repeat domain-containing protein [Gemmatimonadaceae bacterium]
MMPRAVRHGLLLGAMLVGSVGATWTTTPTDAPVADAAMRRDTAKVRLLLKQGADVNAAQGDGMTALHWAATLGDVGQARMLIYAGARLDASTRNGSYTPLHLAARAGQSSVLAVLLDAGANVNAPTTSGGATALHLAAAQGNADAVTVLLSHGAPVNARDSAFQQTPIMWAAAYNRVAAMKVLIAKGADLKVTSRVEDVAALEKAERQALMLRARRLAALKAAEKAPGKGADSSNARKDSTVKATPAKAGKDSASYPAPAAKDAGRDLVGKGTQPADPAKKTAATDTATAHPPTDAAAKTATRDSTTKKPSATADSQRVINAGASYGDLVGNKGGLTPLLFAVRQGNAEAVDALLDAGADVNQVSAGDHTSPLLMATINGQFDLAKRLLARGANVKLASDAGATPLYATINVQWAAKSLYPQPTAQTQQKTDYLELMAALLKGGADPNARLTKHLWYMSYNFDLLGVNTDGATPFWRAAYGTDVAAMKLLIANGADPNIPTRKPAGRQRNDDDSPPDANASGKDPSGLPPVADGGPGVYPIHAASGVGYGEGYAANAHRHVPDGWMPAVKYLVEELHADVNARDFNGYNPIHHAAARGDNELIQYLVSKGGDVMAVSRKGQTTTDMANGPVQRIPPFLDTVALLEKLGAKNNHKCKSC